MEAQPPAAHCLTLTLSNIPKYTHLHGNGGLIGTEEEEPRDGDGVGNSQPKAVKQGVLRRRLQAAAGKSTCREEHLDEAKLPAVRRTARQHRSPEVPLTWAAERVCTFLGLVRQLLTAATRWKQTNSSNSLQFRDYRPHIRQEAGPVLAAPGSRTLSASGAAGSGPGGRERGRDRGPRSRRSRRLPLPAASTTRPAPPTQPHLARSALARAARPADPRRSCDTRPVPVARAPSTPGCRRSLRSGARSLGRRPAHGAREKARRSIAARAAAAAATASRPPKPRPRRALPPIGPRPCPPTSPGHAPRGCPPFHPPTPPSDSQLPPFPHGKTATPPARSPSPSPHLFLPSTSQPSTSSYHHPQPHPPEPGSPQTPSIPCCALGRRRRRVSGATALAPPLPRGAVGVRSRLRHRGCAFSRKGPAIIHGPSNKAAICILPSRQMGTSKGTGHRGREAEGAWGAWTRSQPPAASAVPALCAQRGAFTRGPGGLEKEKRVSSRRVAVNRGEDTSTPI
ncbi:uncharacterized protein [Manis javanica]|uniref:uncharacterized protein n=1 Tax=Manis javanica TaxID=9974 RepID=UPI003C6D1DF5